MKTISSLRVLSLLSFLLLMAPFYDHCNGQRMKKIEAAAAAAAEEEIVPETEINTTEKNIIVPNNDTINDAVVEEIPFYQKAYEFIDDKDSETAFEIAMICNNYFETTFKEFKKELIKDIKKEPCKVIAFHLKNICFVFIILLSFLMFLFSFAKRVRLVYVYSFINLVLLLTTLICIVFFEGFFENINQIKWGYYAFIIVQIAIVYISKKDIAKHV